MKKEEIDARLRATGAFYVADMDDAHELWATSWGFEVWVPVAGPFGDIDEQDLLEIIDEILASKPGGPSPP